MGHISLLLSGFVADRPHEFRKLGNSGASTTLFPRPHSGSTASGKNCGKGGKSTRKVTETELDEKAKAEGREVRMCTGRGCDRRGLIGGQHWMSRTRP